MSTKIYNKTNFHKHTFCIFQEVAFETIKGLKLHYKSKSGSSYYFVENGVFRLSNHWSRVANCRWRLSHDNLKNNFNTKDRIKIGFAKWTDFYPDNDFEKLYFIVYDGISDVNYFHKNNENFTNQILRTSPETTKVIKQIRALLEETAWAKHLNEANIETLRNKIILELISTNQTFQEIRRKFL